LTAATIGIVPAIDRRVEIETFVKIGEVEAAATGINVNVTGWLEVGPSMGVTAEDTDGKIVGDSVINPAIKPPTVKL
jgi:hypothetical protein